MNKLYVALRNAKEHTREWEVACRNIFNKYYKSMTQVCQRSTTRVIAQEVASTGMYRVMTNHDKFNPINPTGDGTDFDAWVFRVTLNCLLDELRANREHMEYIEDLVLHGDFQELSESHSDWEEVLGDAKILVGAKELEILLDYHDLGGEACAEKYHVTIESMWKRISRIRKALKPWIKSEILYK